METDRRRLDTVNTMETEHFPPLRRKRLPRVPIWLYVVISARSQIIAL